MLFDFESFQSRHIGPNAEETAAMLEAGAAMVDVGGESTRPGAAAVWEGDELKRVVPAVERLAASGAAISIDTRRPAVMEAALVCATADDPRAAAQQLSTALGRMLRGLAPR